LRFITSLGILSSLGFWGDLDAQNLAVEVSVGDGDGDSVVSGRSGELWLGATLAGNHDVITVWIPAV
jgi:hypothetical protein